MQSEQTETVFSRRKNNTVVHFSFGYGMQNMLRVWEAHVVASVVVVVVVSGLVWSGLVCCGVVWCRVRCVVCLVWCVVWGVMWCGVVVVCV